MMAKGRIFSLRGKVDCDDNALLANHLIFDYVSPDRQKAWRVEAAWLWPIDSRASTGAVDGFLNAQACLATDVLFHPQFADIQDPTDNRQFAWASQTYNIRDAPTDFATPNGFPLEQARFLVDPDTLITKELYLDMATTTDSATSPARQWGFMVVLREVKVTAAQSLFQQIKGMGQSVEGV